MMVTIELIAIRNDPSLSSCAAMVQSTCEEPAFSKKVTRDFAVFNPAHEKIPVDLPNDGDAESSTAAQSNETAECNSAEANTLAPAITQYGSIALNLQTSSQQRLAPMRVYLVDPNFGKAFQLADEVTTEACVNELPAPSEFHRAEVEKVFRKVTSTDDNARRFSTGKIHKVETQDLTASESATPQQYLTKAANGDDSTADDCTSVLHFENGIPREIYIMAPISDRRGHVRDVHHRHVPVLSRLLHPFRRNKDYEHNDDRECFRRSLVTL
jgi:hypothetical protein